VTYRVNEVFYSLQGEGAQAGTPYVFVRLAGCNLTCSREVEGFDCDTEFVSGTPMALGDLVELACTFGGEGEVSAVKHGWQKLGGWVCLTGGEPTLHDLGPLVAALKERGRRVAIETNGTGALPDGLDWISVSPKTAEHTLKVTRADEVRYVRALTQAIPRPRIKADHYFISPACGASGAYDGATLAHAVDLIKENPEWRLSLQTHKLLSIR
jgi:organic radical activating enzyme